MNLPWPNEGQGWMDVDGLGTMGDFGKQTPVAIGSVAKTMTAYIILRDHPLKPGQEGPKIKVDPTAEKEGGYNKSGESTLNTVKAGDSLTEKQALSAVMIPSANNIARLLARWDAGSEAAFVKKMNATAKELGMTGTTYTDPSGLKETTVSTAHDQVRLGRAVVKQPALVAITSAASWTDPTGHNWPNYNSLPYWSARSASRPAPPPRPAATCCSPPARRSAGRRSPSSARSSASTSPRSWTRSTRSARRRCWAPSTR